MVQSSRCEGRSVARMSNRPTNARTIHQTVRAVDLSKTSPMRDDASFTEGLREIEGYFSIVSISTKLNVVEVLAFEILLRYCLKFDPLAATKLICLFKGNDYFTIYIYLCCETACLSIAASQASWSNYIQYNHLQ